MRTRIKICCISSAEEARMAILHGADAIGLVGRMPSGPGVIDDALVADIARTVPPPIATFLLTSEQSAKSIIDHVRRVNTSTVQIVDELREGAYHEIRAALPGLRIVQVIHVSGRESIAQAESLQDEVDAFLLDSGDPRAAVKMLGGTGKVHDWGISREIVSRVDKPVFLAGGLHPGNVQEAIGMVRPFGVDICSGVRTNGRLDHMKLVSFVEAVQSCFA
ncbi:MAG: phosphoribosylanthranilate isomerase [Bacteroidota bacterium]|nr:phosphoribosylanthranilate isomerase [Bacteroidota bacterium]MDP4255560.1 phosphoribosylanthranilate isomerase [Bacteroidota bacterium]MDP4259680.1 phosphoribosylanthranilate isomerase [Bacteroidota bacterium]